jgi:hypothetical protein
METMTVLRGAETLWEAAKLTAEIGGFIGVAAGWATLRLQHQRRYLRAVRQLTKLPKYLAQRREAFVVLDWASQSSIDTIEQRLAKTVRLNLNPTAVGLNSYLRPAEAQWLAQANRQLADSAFRNFADDLIERLVLLLDSLTRLQNNRRISNRNLSAEAQRQQQEPLRAQVAEDKRRIEDHLVLMQQYLAGELYPDGTSDTMRRILEEKYRAYQELSAEDLNQV